MAFFVVCFCLLFVCSFVQLTVSVLHVFVRLDLVCRPMGCGCCSEVLFLFKREQVGLNVGIFSSFFLLSVET